MLSYLSLVAMPIILALGRQRQRQRQEGLEFEASLDYRARPCLKKTKKKKRKY
jgi:hypothetical protein